MKRSHTFIIVFLVLLLLTFPVIFVYYDQYITGNSYMSAPSNILGGFSIDTPEQAIKAAKDGVQVAFQYDQPPSENNKLGQTLRSSHMYVIDGYISGLLHDYECHRTARLRPSLIGPGQFCLDDSYPDLTDEKVLLTRIVAHLKQVKDNQMIIGYWVLDDWVSWDAGSARQILIDIHKLILQNTPGRLAICGFGGSIGRNQEYGWEDWVADNFSPEGCDRVGLYIYTPELPDPNSAGSPDTYNWSMSGILPAIFVSLQRRGWDIKKEPLIGIAQAFGGPIAHTDRYWISPTAKDIEIQSRSFCEHGATGLTFYAWNDSGYGPTTQTPMNSPEIEKGIQKGIATCKLYWNHHSS